VEGKQENGVKGKQWEKLKKAKKIYRGKIGGNGHRMTIHRNN
jgi:hypothetical protein